VHLHRSNGYVKKPARSNWQSRFKLRYVTFIEIVKPLERELKLNPTKADIIMQKLTFQMIPECTVFERFEKELDTQFTFLIRSLLSLHLAEIKKNIYMA